MISNEQSLEIMLEGLKALFEEYEDIIKRYKNQIDNRDEVIHKLRMEIIELSKVKQ